MAGASDKGDWSSDDLPDLPEEWGVIVIPDDLSELGDEVEAIRAEFRISARRSRWRRWRNRPAVRRLRKVAALTLRAPVLIISLAVLVTVASLFASAWPGTPRPSASQRTTGAGGTAEGTTGDKLPTLELAGSDGQPVSLNAQLPAVILLTDGCDCDRLVADTTRTAPPGIAIVVVAAEASAAATSQAAAQATASQAVTPPTGATPQPQGKNVKVLHDSSHTVRDQLKVGPADDTAAALLVDRTGTIIRRVTRVASVDSFQADLARLAA